MPQCWQCSRTALNTNYAFLAYCNDLTRFPSCSRQPRGSGTRQRALQRCCVSAQTAVHTGNTPFGRGLLSKKDISNRTQLLSVPFEQLLLLPEKLGGSFDTVHAKYAASHAYIPEKLRRFVQGKARWDLRLTAWLLWLSKYGSNFWQDYIKGLPKEADMTCLLNYLPAEQSELQWLSGEAAVQHSWAAESHASLFCSKEGFLKELQLADSLQETLWAMSLVRSRTFSDKVYDTELSLMVPQADLANHAFQPNAVYALKASQGIFELRSCSPIAAGQPICITYGTEKTNFELMRDYGFIVPGNPNDRLDFSCSPLQQRPAVVAKPAQMLFKMLNAAPAPISKEEQPQLLQGPLLAALGLEGKVEAGKLCPTGMSCQDTEAACLKDAALSRKLAAVLSLPVTETARAAQTEGNRFWPPKAWTDSGEPPLRKNLRRQEAAQQRQAADQLQRHCHSMTAKSGTSLATDADLLTRETQLTVRHAQAMHARLEQKQLIAAAQQVLQTYIDSMLNGVSLPYRVLQSR